MQGSNVVRMETLTAGFRKQCQSWWDDLAGESRAALDAWLSSNPVPPAHATDLVPYAYIEAPITIDPWVVCKTAAADADSSWLADIRPSIVEILPTGDVLARFRQSELVAAE